jgi:5-formyltetrahydrofolate cyclo-ligase
MRPPPNPNKAAVRHQLREAIRHLPPDHRAAVSPALCQRLASLPEWTLAPVILAFAPRPDEPNILPALHQAFAQHKQVGFPARDPATGLYLYREMPPELEGWIPGAFHLPEPPPTAPILQGNPLDFTLVPGLGFTPDGRRLGRGQGHYDRLLRSIRGFKCGVAFDAQIVDSLPTEPHDVVLDCILTPSRTWRATPGGFERCC